MKANRLIFALLLASSVAVVQLAAQQTKADQKPIEEVKAKAEAGDADSQVELGRRYDKGEGVAKDQVEAVKWYRKAAEQNYARGQYDLGVCYAIRRRRDEGSSGSGEVVSQSRRPELRRGSIQSGRLLRQGRRRGEGSGGGGEVVSQSRRAESRRGSIQSGCLLRTMAKAWRRIRWRR